MMTEKDKMLAGDSYDSRDKELIQMYHSARKLLHQYNNLNSESMQERDQILTELLEFKGSDVWVEAPFFCDYGTNISIGRNTFINTNCIFLDNNKITIGENGLIGPMVQIYTANHRVKASERIVKYIGGTSYLTSALSVHIGDNVWIGGGAIILPGVTIGKNVTIGAGSVVVKNVPDDVLAFGNPCEIRRQL